MSIIYKYPFTGTNELVIPHYRSSVVLVSYNPQKNSDVGLPVLWVEHTAPPKPTDSTRRFLFFGTGDTFDETDLIHVGSAVCGPYVWHVYKDRYDTAPDGITT